MKEAKFIQTLYAILENEEWAHIIKWNNQGNGFVILDKNAFVKLLSDQFHHSKLSSFQRQLGMYSFEKANIDGIKQFVHPLFIRGRKESMKNIKRRVRVHYPTSTLSSSIGDLQMQVMSLQQGQKEIIPALAEQTQKLLLCQQYIKQIIAQQVVDHSNDAPKWKKFNQLLHHLIFGMIPEQKSMYLNLMCQAIGAEGIPTTPVSIEKVCIVVDSSPQQYQKVSLQDIECWLLEQQNELGKQNAL